MKLQIFGIAAVAALASAHVLPPDDNSLTNLTHNADLKDTSISVDSSDPSPDCPNNQMAGSAY